jgi:Fe-S-cluster containining protein
VRINDDMSDKYAIPQEEIPIIDCESRYHLCHGACCALRFPLTRQDIGEGIVRWEFDQPYTIRHGPDDLCVHQDRGSCRCSIYANRPAICRTYSCRDDRRIWQDFDQRIINPDLFVVGENGERRVQFLVGRDGTPVATEGELMAPAQPVPAEAR